MDLCLETTQAQSLYYSTDTAKPLLPSLGETMNY